MEARTSKTPETMVSGMSRMKAEDRNLGMDRSISRRDVLLGMGALAASTFMPGRAFADEALRLERAGIEKASTLTKSSTYSRNRCLKSELFPKVGDGQLIRQRSSGPFQFLP